MYNQRKVLGICNLHGSPKIGGFSANRSLGSTTFLGRYAMIDFTLSNFANSGIDCVCILVDKFYHSILAHVGSGQSWTSNTKVGYEYLMFNEEAVSKPEINNDINNIISNKGIFNKLDFDYVVIAPTHYLSSMDFRPIIEQHISNGASITAVYLPIYNGKESFGKSKCVSLNLDGTVKRIYANNKKSNNINVLLDTYIISRAFLQQICQRQIELSRRYSLLDMIKRILEEGETKVYSYKFEHYVLPIMSMSDYIDGSYELLTYDNRRRIFRNDWPVCTTTHDTPPTKYGESANVQEAIISNGCKINGKVKHSILSRNVVVEKGAEIVDSIIFTGVIIKKGVKLSNAYVDKGCVISKSIKGTKEEPIFIKGGIKH